MILYYLVKISEGERIDRPNETCQSLHLLIKSIFKCMELVMTTTTVAASATTATGWFAASTTSTAGALKDADVHIG